MAKGGNDTVQTNVRLSTQGRQLLESLSDMLGVSHKDVIEIAIRRFAREEGLWSPRSLTEPRGNVSRRHA